MIKEIWVFYKETYNSRWGKRIYEVSNYGRVKCNDKLFKCSIGTDGYYYLCGIPLHRIIAEKFIPGWKKDYEIDHKDRNKLNNMVTNLLVCDHKTNMNNPLSIQHMSNVKIGSIPWNKGKKGLQTGWNKGQHLTEETKKKISESHKGKYISEETKKKIIEGSHKKPVLQYTLDNKLVTEYVSVNEAFRETKIYPGSIVKCCKHKLKSAGGYIWRYKKEDLI